MFAHRNIFTSNEEFDYNLHEIFPNLSAYIYTLQAHIPALIAAITALPVHFLTYRLPLYL